MLSHLGHQLLLQNLWTPQVLSFLYRENYRLYRADKLWIKFSPVDETRIFLSNFEGLLFSINYFLHRNGFLGQSALRLIPFDHTLFLTKPHISKEIYLSFDFLIAFMSNCSFFLPLKHTESRKGSCRLQEYQHMLLLCY